MIEGEIKVGDRLRRNRHDGWSYIEIVTIGHDGYQVRTPRGRTWVSISVIRGFYERDPDPQPLPPELNGWTPITPETLPGEDLEEVVVLDENGVKSFAKRNEWLEFHPNEGWKYLAWTGTEFTHWRPVPDDWFPLPKLEGRIEMIVCDLCKDIRKRTTNFHIVLRANSTEKKPDRDVIKVDVALCNKCVSSFCSRMHHFVFDIRKQVEDTESNEPNEPSQPSHP